MNKESTPQNKTLSYKEKMQRNAAKALKNGEQLPLTLIIALLEMDG